ncbi:MAG: amidohydrolase family protein [Chitinophagaceae bacterium]
MGFRKFRPNQLFNGYTFLNEEQVLITKPDGTVEGLVSMDEAGDDIEKLDGILTPGLINCHCHLELSHLKNVIPPHTGLVEFLCSVVTKRGFAAELVQQEIEKAEQEMYENGIAAAGDICNTADAVRIKSGSNMRWQNFIEVLSFTDAKAIENMAHYETVLHAHKAVLFAPNRNVLTPHAPYSISPKTFELLNAATANQIISIHNQEHPAEDELYKTGGGDYLKLFKIFGVESSPFPVTGKSSLQSYLPYFKNGQTIFLIHNTYMPQEDIAFANDYAKENGLTLVYCLCPNANLYIENKLPEAEKFIDSGCHIVLGTDSYSSNWQLSIAKEIQTIHQHFPALALETILQWATSNGAKALQWDNELGSFEKGKRPGVTLLANDLGSSVRVL